MSITTLADVDVVAELLRADKTVCALVGQAALMMDWYDSDRRDGKREQAMRRDAQYGAYRHAAIIAVEETYGMSYDRAADAIDPMINAMAGQHFQD